MGQGCGPVSERVVDLIAEVDRARWSVTDGGPARARRILALAAQPEVLEGLLERIPANPKLVTRCQRKPYQDKLVLSVDADAGPVMILHHFRQGHADRAAWIHNHRADFAARIVTGGYAHTLYSVSERPGDGGDQPFEVSELYARDERAGDTYVLSQDAFHTVRAEGDTVTLVVRATPHAIADREPPLYVSDDGRRYFRRSRGEVQDNATRPMHRAEVPNAVDEILAIVSRRARG